ncbi:hypothetical protein [Maribellus sediminis]|uniref:hypothetical protein n=1 Tax=Maribellus sediminis TaxID=2696285 RepID=UPI00143144A7|nr:hypothetical protein [Maribellus sediminis]
MKNPLYVLIGLILFIVIIIWASVAPPTSKATPFPTSPDEFGTHFFNCLKTNDLNSFRNYFLSEQELRDVLANGSLNIPKEEHQNTIDFYLKDTGKPGFVADVLDDFRSDRSVKGVDWSDSYFESVEYSVDTEELEEMDVYYFTITFLCKGERYKFDKIGALKVRYYYNEVTYDRYILFF